MEAAVEQQQQQPQKDDDNDVYTCQHGGPGEVTRAQKNLFVVSYATNLARVRRQQQGCGYALHEQVVATELVVLEELLTKNATTLKPMVDAQLVKLYFGLAADCLLRARLDEARVHARAGVYLALYLRHGGGDALWSLTQQSPETQKETLLLSDMHTALGQIALDSQLPKFLRAQTPCDCLERAFPALKDKK